MSFAHYRIKVAMFEYIMICLIMLHRYLWLYSDSEAFTNVFGSELISDLMGNLVESFWNVRFIYRREKSLPSQHVASLVYTVMQGGRSKLIISYLNIMLIHKIKGILYILSKK